MSEYEPFLNKKEVRSLVQKILHLHGLTFQENIHGKMIDEVFGE